MEKQLSALHSSIWTATCKSKPSNSQRLFSFIGFCDRCNICPPTSALSKAQDLWQWVLNMGIGTREQRVLFIVNLWLVADGKESADQPIE